MSESSSQPFMRTIRSFVRREGRMTRGQQRAMDEIFPNLGIEYQEKFLNLEEIFGRQAPTVLEIGFGMGASLVEQAKQNPQRNYLGIEVHRPGVGACLVLAEENKVENLRVVNHDAVEVLNHMISEQSLAGTQVYFPDPWHKKKHHKRRIIQSEFVRLIAQKTLAGGFLHLATDWEGYAEHMLAVMGEAADWRNLSESGDFIPRPPTRPLTKFEHRGERLGHGVWDLMFERC